LPVGNSEDPDERPNDDQVLHRRHSTPTSCTEADDPRHPCVPILEDQGLALEKINVLARLIANSDVDGALNVLPACISTGWRRPRPDAPRP
jgi:hypothetical protein